MRAWSVVIPSDSKEKLSASVTALRKAHDGLDLSRVIAVSRVLSRKDLPGELREIRVIRDEGKFVFARRVNTGFAKAEPHDVVVMGDDVEVATPGAFDLIAREAPLRILSAAIRGRVGPWWQREGSTHPEVPFLSFICVYIPRMVYEMVGPLEEGFTGYGYEDTDYCIRARRAGLSCGVSANAVVEHGVNLKSEFVATHGDREMVALEEEARQQFWAKWKRRLR